jgi:hypothetical protein
VHNATGSVTIMGSDGRDYQVQATFQSAAPAQGSPTDELTLSITPCSISCGTGFTYAVPLGPGVASFNSSPGSNSESVTIHTRFGGAPLELSWFVQHAAGVNAGVSGGANGVGVVDPASGGSGQLAVTLWHLSCSGNGSISDTFFAGTSGPADLGGGTPPRSAPAAFRPHGRHHAVCGPDAAR